MKGAVHIEQPADHVRSLVIDKPPANALDAEMLSLLLEQLEAIQADSEVRAIVLTGTGKYFCSGADLKAQGGEALKLFGKFLNSVEMSKAPVIAAINGWCVGGGFELSLCCDIRVASDSARFVCAGVNVGLMASTYRLPRLIGTSRAKLMLLTGSQFDAATVEEVGVTVATFDQSELLTEATQLAARIASRAPLSVAAAKRISSVALDHDRRAIRELENKELEILQNSADHKEALQAFKEKRDPKFSGH